MKARIITQVLRQKINQKTGRILVLTGARQIGKTVTTANCFPDFDYLSIEDPVKRPSFMLLTAEQWQQNFPKAILDEVQKEHQLIESIKSVYDQYPEPRYVLLGSSQFLLLEKVRESLAGRCVILEMYPLTIPELMTDDFDETVKESFLIQYIKDQTKPETLLPSFNLDSNFAKKMKAYEFYLSFGGYPVLTHDEMDDELKREWLSNYVKTFLERDVRDLAAFRDLEPFVKLQRYLANISGKLVNYSSISKEVGVSVPTVKRYIQYMEMSYQTITLSAWHANPLKKLIKSPKVHFMDYGVLQTIAQKTGEPAGNEYESAIVAEIYKQIKSYQLPVHFYHLRTQDGREIDLLIETSDYFIAIEIKKKNHIRETDARNIKGLEEILNKPIRHAFILSNDQQVKHFESNITAMHAAQFLG